MEQVQFCESTEFGAIRMVDDNGKILFCGTDAAHALGYAKPQDAIQRHCREDGSVIRGVTDSLGRTQQAKFIDEGNLYRLIVHSKLPTAEKFERWVFDEVLPAIRRNGAYVPELYDGAEDTAVPQEILTAHDYLQAARLVANCADKRLPLVLDLLHKGGWDVEVLPEMQQHYKTLAEGNLLVDVTDIQQRIRHAQETYHLTWESLSEITGFAKHTLRSYGYGVRFPKPDRYMLLCAKLEDYELTREKEEANVYPKET